MNATCLQSAPATTVQTKLPSLGEHRSETPPPMMTASGESVPDVDTTCSPGASELRSEQSNKVKWRLMIFLTPPAFTRWISTSERHMTSSSHPSSPASQSSLASDYRRACLPSLCIPCAPSLRPLSRPGRHLSPKGTPHVYQSCLSPQTLRAVSHT